MTKLWRIGRKVEVTVDDRDIPIAFHWNGRVHRIVSISKRWRVHSDWWRTEVWRDYLKVATDSGLLCIIYQDLEGHWYLQRIYD